MILQANGFDWDRGNRGKCEKHGLSVSVIEGLFTRPLAILPDAAHSQPENRFRARGGRGQQVWCRSILIVAWVWRGTEKTLNREVVQRIFN